MTISLPVRHLVVRQDETLPPPAGLYDYLYGGNGTFIRARRSQAQACVPVASLPEGTIRGLQDLPVRVELLVPRVPTDLTQQMLDMAREAKDSQGRPVEIMFHLTYTAVGWELVKPAQRQGVGFVHPVGPYAGTSYATYLVNYPTPKGGGLRACSQARS